MKNLKVAIVYYSQTGHNFTMAKWAKEQAEELGAEVRLVKVKELLDTTDANPGWAAYLEASKDVAEATSDDLVWADVVILSTPTRFGNVAAQMKFFLDGQGQVWGEGKLTNKVVTAMTSAQNNHGGQEATLLSLYKTMMHWGAIIVTPGYTDGSVVEAGGNPYGTSGTVTREGFLNDLEGAVKHQAKHTIEVAQKFVS